MCEIINGSNIWIAVEILAVSIQVIVKGEVVATISDKNHSPTNIHNESITTTTTTTQTSSTVCVRKEGVAWLVGNGNVNVIENVTGTVNFDVQLAGYSNDNSKGNSTRRCVNACMSRYKKASSIPNAAKTSRIMHGILNRKHNYIRGGNSSGTHSSWLCVVWCGWLSQDTTQFQIQSHTIELFQCPDSFDDKPVCQCTTPPKQCHRSSSATTF